MPLHLTVQVATRTSLDLSADEGRTVVRGESVDYAIVVTNTGNSHETIDLEVSSRLRSTLSVEKLALAQGEARVVTLSLSAAGSFGGRDIAIVRATPSSAPTAARSVIVRTIILPFAGADELTGSVMRYRLDGSASYGTGGFGTRLRGQLDGQLSAYVDGQADLTLRVPPGAAPRLSGSAAVLGDDWGVSYRGSARSQRLETYYRDADAYIVDAGAGLGFGVAYRPMPFYVRASQLAGPANRQSLEVGYRFQAAPELALTPIVNVSRSGDLGASVFTGAVGVAANLQTEPVIGTARAYLPLPLDDTWNLTAALSSRAREPVSVQGLVSVGGQHLNASVAVNETLSDELTLQQHLSYTGTGNLNLGVRYRPRLDHVSLAANVGAHYDGQDVDYSYGTTATYDPSPINVSAHLFGTPDGIRSYGATLGYNEGAFGGSIGYAHTFHDDRLTVALRTTEAGFSASANYRYDITNAEHRGNIALEYQAPNGQGLFATMGFEDTLSWRVGATIGLDGGFSTPDSIVNTFGGRALGSVTGKVFQDLNRDGVQGPDEPPVVGVNVTAGTMSAISDLEGQYRLALPPGSQLLRVSGASASFALSIAPVVDVTLGQEQRLDLPLVTVGAIVVTVFNDVDHDGERDNGESTLPWAEVTARRSGDGKEYRSTAKRGEAVFQGLAPGTYTVDLVPESLPTNFVPIGEALTIQLSAGPIVYARLGAAERPKEVTQALSPGDLTLFARVEPTPAPRGADILVTASVQGAADTVTATLGGTTVQLTLGSAGVYEGRLSLPIDAKQVETVTVTAQNRDERREQVIPVLVSSSPLGRVTLRPGIADPGETVDVEAVLLTRVDVASVVIDGKEHDLEATDDPYTFVGRLTAPSAAGFYPIELQGDRETLAESSLRVR